MGWLAGHDWRRVVYPDMSLLEIVVRGTLVYLALYTLLRLVLKRQRGGVGTTDLLVIVLIADAAQNAMSGAYTSVTDGVLLVATIIFWSAALDWLGYRLPLVQRFLRPAPLVLVEDGRIVRENMAREFVTDDELQAQLRLQGVTDLSEVEFVYMEGDGQISIIRRDGTQTRHHRRVIF